MSLSLKDGWKIIKLKLIHISSRHLVAGKGIALGSTWQDFKVK